jgi:hypothetical protein
MPLFDGRWIVTLPAGPAATRQGELRLDGFAGTWRYASGQRKGKDPCRGRHMPVTVQVSRAERLELSIWGSAVAPDCPDLSLVLAPLPIGKPAHGSAPRTARKSAHATELAGEVNGTPGALAQHQRR